VSTLNVAVKRREYLPKDELRFCGMSNDASAGLKILILEAIPIITPIQQAITCTLFDAQCQSGTSFVAF